MLDINGNFPKYQLPRPISSHEHQNLALPSGFSKKYYLVLSDELAFNYSALSKQNKRGFE